MNRIDTTEATENAHQENAMDQLYIVHPHHTDAADYRGNEVQAHSIDQALREAEVSPRHYTATRLIDAVDLDSLSATELGMCGYDVLVKTCGAKCDRCLEIGELLGAQDVRFHVQVCAADAGGCPVIVVADGSEVEFASADESDVREVLSRIGR